MAAKLIWHGPEFEKKLRAQLAVGLSRVGRHCVDQIRMNMSPSSPSKPGTPPARGEGTYARSIAYEVDRQRLVCRVGTNDKRGKWLELGTGSRAKFGGSAYVIVPKNARALMWKATGAGPSNVFSLKGGDLAQRDSSKVYAKRVVHPGMFPRPHILIGVQKAVPEIERILKEAVKV